MNELYLIVEGDGEERAAPLLVRRILQGIYQRYDVSMKNTHVYNAHGNGNLTTQNGLERFLELVRRQPCDGLIVLLDVETQYIDCPPSLACWLSDRAAKLKLPFPVAVVCAACEYESWFLYSRKVASEYLLPNVLFVGNPEQVCSAREWLQRNMQPGIFYKETIDQEKMTAYLELDEIYKQSRSLRRMIESIGDMLESIDQGRSEVTPTCNNGLAD